MSYIVRFIGDPGGYTVDKLPVLPSARDSWVEARRGTHVEKLWIDVSKAYLIERKP